jgi:hypothetical protein
MPDPDTQVPVQAPRGLVADLDRPGLTAPAADSDLPLPQGDVAAPLERPARTGALQPGQVPVGENRHRLMRTLCSATRRYETPITNNFADPVLTTRDIRAISTLATCNQHATDAGQIISWEPENALLLPAPQHAIQGEHGEPVTGQYLVTPRQMSRYSC